MPSRLFQEPGARGLVGSHDERDARAPEHILEQAYADVKWSAGVRGLHRRQVHYDAMPLLPHQESPKRFENYLRFCVRYGPFTGEENAFPLFDWIEKIRHKMGSS